MNIQVDQEKSIVYVKPNGALTEENFLALSKIVDPIISQHGHLKGLVIETMKFPGWENLKAFTTHVKFIKNHQAKIKKIALVTDSSLADIGRQIIGPFISPEIKHFPYDKVVLATEWINSGQ